MPSGRRCGRRTELLESRTGPGSDFLGWVDLPVDYDKQEFARIKAAAEKIRQDSDVLVVIGIGGSYLGARAAIEAIKGQMYNCTCEEYPADLFCGQFHLARLPERHPGLLRGQAGERERDLKSGTTTEPALAFRVFKSIWKTAMALKKPESASTPPPTRPAAP